MTIDTPRLCAPLFVLVLAGCANVPSTSTPEDPLTQCTDLGFAPDTPAMQRCLEADSRIERVVLADQETYGTF
jgi:hypothetical protein